MSLRKACHLGYVDLLRKRYFELARAIYKKDLFKPLHWMNIAATTTFKRSIANQPVVGCPARKACKVGSG
jgi:hypothetical protein